MFKLLSVLGTVPKTSEMQCEQHKASPLMKDSEDTPFLCEALINAIHKNEVG